MAWKPISGTVPQYEVSGVAAVDHYLKFYAAGTTTAISMATDTTGGTTLAKSALDANGFPLNGSSAIFIPHINQKYKIALYLNATDADNNTTGNAVWVIDGNSLEDHLNMAFYELGTQALAASHTSVSTGFLIKTDYYDTNLTLGSGGVHRFNGTTTGGKAGNWPDADGYFYDADGKMFALVGPEINVLAFGAVGDDTTLCQTPVQAAQAYSEATGRSLYFDVGTYKFTATVTSSATGGVYWKGPTGGQLDASSYPAADIKFYGAATDDNLLEMGNNTHLILEGLYFSTSDGTKVWNIIKSATTQDSSAGLFRVKNCTAQTMGGRWLWLGGGGTAVQWYGEISSCAIQNVAQWLNVNGNGEVVMRDIQAVTINTTAGLTAGEDAWCYIEDAIVKFEGGSSFADAANVRDWFNLASCRQIMFEGTTTLERVTNAAPTKNIINVSGASNSVQMFDVSGLKYVASSINTAPTGFVIETTGSATIQQMRIGGNSFVSADHANVDGIPFIKLNSLMPQIVEINENYRAPARAPLVEVADGTASNSNLASLGGLRGNAFEFYNFTSEVFTVSATDTDAIAPVNGGGENASLDTLWSTFTTNGEWSQIFPISLEIHSDLSTAETITFQLGRDTTNDSDVLDMSGVSGNRIHFPLRAQYYFAPDPATWFKEYLRYTSSSASTTRKYICQFKYAVLRVFHGSTNSDGTLLIT